MVSTVSLVLGLGWLGGGEALRGDAAGSAGLDACCAPGERGKLEAAAASGAGMGAFPRLVGNVGSSSSLGSNCTSTGVRRLWRRAWKARSSSWTSGPVSLGSMMTALLLRAGKCLAVRGGDAVGDLRGGGDAVGDLRGGWNAWVSPAGVARAAAAAANRVAPAAGCAAAALVASAVDRVAPVAGWAGVETGGAAAAAACKLLSRFLWWRSSGVSLVGGAPGAFQTVVGGACSLVRRLWRKRSSTVSSGLVGATWMLALIVSAASCAFCTLVGPAAGSWGLGSWA